MSTNRSKQGSKLPLYTAEPGPKDKAYTNLLSSYNEARRPSAYPSRSDGALPSWDVIGFHTVQHNHLGPDLYAGQMVPVVEPIPMDTIHVVRFRGVTFACRVDNRSVKGKVRLWLSHKLSQEGCERVVDEGDLELEIIGAAVVKNGSMQRSKYFWPALHASSN